MHNLTPAIWVELLKVRRSRMPLYTLLGFALAPLAGGFFMIVLKDPELARRVGIISAKAQIVAGAADWPTYLGFLAQATAVGGFILFSLIVSWVFGREFADYTVKDLLALPTPRSSLVLAKFIVVAVWSAVLTAMIFVIGVGVGQVVGLPPAPAGVWGPGTVVLAITAGLTIALVTPVAFFASAGRGYLPPMGAAILVVVLTQIIAAAGWGDYFPWSIPALYAGIGGVQSLTLSPISYALVGATGLVGVIATLVWWELADQPR
ncbi:MAG TPA: ABC transporter permease [Anaerolineae bacterium]|nr:ABC transporter permease [Anaerolineae bacterium]